MRTNGPAVIVQHPSALVHFDPREQPTQDAPSDQCIACGFTTAAHLDANRNFISCATLIDRSVAAAKFAQETERVEALARLLSAYDQTDQLLAGDPALWRHYLRAAWIARRLSTVGDQRDTVQALANLQGADGCAAAYYDSEDMSAPYLSTNVPERRLWTSVFSAGFQSALDFLGRIGGEREQARISGIWRSVTGANWTPQDEINWKREGR